MLEKAVEKRESSLHRWWECKLLQPLWKRMEVSQKTKNRTTIWSSNPTAGHISGQNYNSKRTCTPMFIAALFTIAKTWKQPKCPSTDEWIKKMWYRGRSRWQRSKTWRSPSSPQIHQKYNYIWNNSCRTSTEHSQKTSDFPKGSWCSGRGSGLSLWGGRTEFRTLDHQRPPGPM